MRARELGPEALETLEEIVDYIEQDAKRQAGGEGRRAG